MLLRYLPVAVLFLACGPAIAESADEAAISTMLHGTFDKPGTALKVAPIIVSGDHAIADWSQADMGGRALLRRRLVWTLILCAGDAIKSRDALAKAGVPAEDAARMERDLAAAEAKLDANDVAMFSRFEGLVMMD